MNMSALSVKELRAQLRAANVSYEGCVEEDFGLSPHEPAQGRQVELRIDEKGEDHMVYCSCMYYVMMGLPCRQCLHSCWRRRADGHGHAQRQGHEHGRPR